MANNTPAALQRQIIYSVYVRAHTPEGTFRSVVPDLDRIRALGADWIWFLPIHPIGVKGKKGSLGCPYANRDYRGTNPCYGSIEDFRFLCDEIHRRGMKVMIDVVYNHTSPDAVLLSEHPEFYYRDSAGNLGNKIGDWADVIDLDYRNRGLWDYQIESLRFWASIVDGFRCDVASFVPLDFWRAARAAVAEVNPDCVWLAESVHMSFGNFARAGGFVSTRDTELFDAFDIEYQYDVWECFERFLAGEGLLHEFTEQLRLQEALYRENYNKLRFLENHDQPRFRSRIETEDEQDNFTAMLFFLKGTTLLYAGQEFSCTHLPSLFEREVIDRSGRNISPLLMRLAAIKKTALGCRDSFDARADDEKAIAVMERRGESGLTVGVFSLRGRSGAVALDIPDGRYADLISGGDVLVENGQVFCTGKPVIFTCAR